MESDSGRWSSVRRLFEEALDRREEERAPFLESACGADAALRAEVEQLLASHRPDEGSLAPPLAGEVEPPLPPGTRIGAFEVVALLATGGMGAVYEAMQQQPRRSVALKVMRAGLASRAALRRFEFEAEVLGRLRHPGIAQIYEAGTHATSAGPLPYFAMELVVGGIPITQFARARKLDARARVGLLAEICDAVHHGHSKGVIHRDLKPANLLADPAGRPKVIDFGVARSVDSDVALTTLRTDVGQLVGTLPYMSPEQCDARPDELDARSDVYSLGVVLYELLCDELPYRADVARPLAALRAIREEPPKRPSVRGDLETILLKALEKDRERRYSSAAELSGDLRAWLGSRPISARPASTSIRLARWARREPAKATLAAALAVGIPAMAALAGFAAARSREAEVGRAAAKAERVERSLERASLDLAALRIDDAVARFGEVLAEDSENPEAIGGVAMAKLSRGDAGAALSLFDAHAATTARHPALARIRGDALARLGRPSEATAPASRPSSLEALLEGQRLIRSSPDPSPEVCARAAQLFASAARTSPRARALNAFLLAEAAGKGGIAPAAQAASETLEALWPDSALAWHWIAFALSDFDPKRAADAGRRALALDPTLADAETNLGGTLRNLGDLPGAIAAHRRAIALSPRHWRALYNLGNALYESGDLPGAIESYRAALAIEPRQVAAWNNLGNVLDMNGEAADAVAAYRRALEIDPRSVSAHVNLADTLLKLGDSPGAAAEAAEAIRLDPKNEEARKILEAAKS